MSKFLKPELEKFYEIAKLLETESDEKIKLKFIRFGQANTLNIVVECPFELRDKVKAAGFFWNPETRFWHYEFDANFTEMKEKERQGELFDRDKW